MIKFNTYIILQVIQYIYQSMTLKTFVNWRVICS